MDESRAAEILNGPEAARLDASFPNRGHCPQCEARGWDHDKIVDYCRRSLFVVAKVLCGYPDITKRFHGKVAKWVATNIREGNRNMLVLLARGHVKTELLVVAGTIWMLINNPETRILIMQSSAKKASKLMHILMGKLESDRIAHFFPNLVPIPAHRKRWNTEELEVCRDGHYQEASVTCAGLKSRVVGGHYDVIFEDDIIDLNDADSNATMEDAIDWHKNSSPLFIKRDMGVNIVIGTRWADNDVYGWIKRNTGDVYKVLEFGIYADERSAEFDFNEPGKAVWPERFTDQAIAIIRATTDEWVWSHQYLNVALSDAERRFHEENFRWVLWDEPGKVLRNGERLVLVDRLFRVMTVDPSVGESRDADESAIVVSGIDRKRAEIYVLAVWSKRCITPDLIHRIVDMHRQWNPQVCGIESVGFAKTLKYPLLQEMLWQSRQFPIIELQTGGKSKPRRIESLTPYVHNCQVHFLREQTTLLQQLRDWHPAYTGHDDVIDALAYHTPYWQSALPKFEIVNDDEAEDRPKERPRAPLYGLALAQEGRKLA